MDKYRSALERTLGNFRLLLAGRPVKEAGETIAEAEAALRSPDPTEVLKDALAELERLDGYVYGVVASQRVMKKIRAYLINS